MSYTLPSILCFVLVFIFLFWLLIGACVYLHDDDVNINVISLKVVMMN